MKPRRAPSAPRHIKDIGPNDLRVSVVGTIVSTNEVAVLDDGEESITLIFDNPEDLKKLKDGQKIRVFARPSGKELLVDFFQDMGKLNIPLYHQVLQQEDLAHEI